MPHGISGNSKGESWDPERPVNVYAFRVICLRAAQALSPTRKGVSVYPETEEEKAFVERFRKEYPVEDREVALESTLNHFVGGGLQGAITASQPKRKTRTEQVVKPDARW